MERLKRFVGLFLNGLAMGAANKVPGVSGGTIAFALGFYEELINSLKMLDFVALKLLLKGQFSAFYSRVNGRFLVPIFAGSIFSFFSVSQVLDYLILHYEPQVWSLFMGLIVATLVFIFKSIDYFNAARWIAFACALSIGIWISFADQGSENSNYFFVFFCGVISVSGMTIPGLSGSFIVLLVGNYVLLMVDAVNVLYDALKQMVVGDFSFITDEYKLHMIAVLLLFTLGSAVGLVSLSKLLSFVLKRFPQMLYVILAGFITGTLGTIWPWRHY